MPTPAPKSLDQEIDRLGDCLHYRESLGDIERAHILHRLEETKRSEPTGSFLGLAILAAIDGNEKLMRENFKKVFLNAPGDPGYRFDFALVLLELGFVSEAASEFSKAIDEGLSRPHLIEGLAEHALVIGDGDLMLKTLRHANKLQCDGPNILRLAAVVAAANADDKCEKCNMLSLAFSDEELRANSVQITDEMWAEYEAIADKLGKYL